MLSASQKQLQTKIQRIPDVAEWVSGAGLIFYKILKRDNLIYGSSLQTFA
jgi:hypothetical protein